MHDEAIEHFLDEGLIERVIRPIKSGKEASVHLCRANPRTTGEELAALKIYHPLDRRDFRDESIYRDGEFIKERRIRVALDKRTRFGREVQGGIWVSREWETLHALFTAGAPVPRPIETSVSWPSTQTVPSWLIQLAMPFAIVRTAAGASGEVSKATR